MKALFYPAWNKLEVRDVPRPSPIDGEVLIRVSNCGICGSELETFRDASKRRMPPLIMGHEFCGQVEEVRGAKAGGLKGRRVIAHALVHCGECSACVRGDTNLCIRRQVLGMHRPGAFAEYVTAPERVLIPWPDGLPAATAVFAKAARKWYQRDASRTNGQKIKSRSYRGRTNRSYMSFRRQVLASIECRDLRPNSRTSGRCLNAESRSEGGCFAPRPGPRDSEVLGWRTRGVCDRYGRQLGGQTSFHRSPRTRRNGGLAGITRGLDPTEQLCLDPRAEVHFGFPILVP
jgi:Alcohol dehydrogenase GroES-like domain